MKASQETGPNTGLRVSVGDWLPEAMAPLPPHDSASNPALRPATANK